MFIIKSKEDARRLVQEFDTIVQESQHGFKSLAIVTEKNDIGNLVVNVSIVYNPEKDSFYVSDHTLVREELDKYYVLHYAPAMVDIIWTHRKTINKQLRSIQQTGKGGLI